MIIKKFGKFKNIRIVSLLFLFFSLLVVYVFLFSPPLLNKVALALQGDYTGKISGSTVTPEEWNYLDEDFLKKEGDTMGGNLDMGGHSITNLPTPSGTDLNYAATVEYVNALAEAGARDRNGNPLKVICGSTDPLNTNWVYKSSVAIYTDIYTTDNGLPVGSGGTANFSAPPMYFTSLGGISNHEKADSVEAIFFPDYQSFRVELHNPTSITVAEALSSHWYVNWCGVGN